MKNLLTFLIESRGQRLSDRPYNRPYNREQDINDKKKKLSNRHDEYKEAKSIVEYCQYLNDYFKKLKNDVIQLSKDCEKHNVDIKLVFSLDEHFRYSSLVITPKELIEYDMYFECWDNDGNVINTTNDLRLSSFKDYDEMYASISFGGEKLGYPWSWKADTGEDGYEYRISDTINEHNLYIGLIIDESKCDDKIVQAIKNIIIKLINANKIQTNIYGVSKYYSVSKLANKDEIRINYNIPKDGMGFIIKVNDVDNNNYMATKYLLKPFNNL